ncbi:MAG TPA: hypothetical protein VGK62_07010 [Gaiellaceae bacterium]
MKGGLTSAALLVAITVALSGCGGSHRLPAPLLKFIHSDNKGVTGKTVEVYGPASRSAVVQASDPSAVIGNTAAERSGCYLIVYHGHFDWHGPSAGAKQHHYTVLTNVWCAEEGGTDFGFSNHGCPSGCRLSGPTLVSLKR